MDGDLISRSALMEDIQAAAENGGMGAVVAGTLKRYVKRAPAVDAETVCEQMGLVKEAFEMAKADLVPVRHGRWILFRKGDWTSVYACSECHRRVTVAGDKEMVDVWVKKKYPYCHCGAKMDGDSYD